MTSVIVRRCRSGLKIIIIIIILIHDEDGSIKDEKSLREALPPDDTNPLWESCEVLHGVLPPNDDLQQQFDPGWMPQGPADQRTGCERTDEAEACPQLMLLLRQRPREQAQLCSAHTETTSSSVFCQI